MTVIDIIKSTTKVITPIFGGKFMGKFAVKNARKDYKKNVKPPFSPPGYVFPIVWPILYTTMGVAYVLVTNQSERKTLKGIYYTQLGLNYLWSILYFKYKLRFSALVESVVLLGAVVTTTVKFFNVKKVAGILLVPYVLWSAFATYLTAGNWFLNKENPNYTGKTEH
ncbi:tryptophan-rich sensory protein [Staphylococcus nepalensis]|uniref:Tryptophan-rich sensory protein n=1 Tax=Staphylococcus nepalensis TaxID=214473 RepID=A0ABS3L2D0_9STAP|nr:TspO/MBR family protein [Staphylococcus nepalensis]MBO1212232.1 tryptophan-rich sensory protein [Staphylococcus nepalensis]MBO1217355.1 tryptophan-rich sensory protein [Staphylococcus nepalensis]MBO1227709.1 tryptophan-rich sensory protein [Staphylococcus nepalensis]MBO1235393.1 tryptophan-rich sensory protein [Staphylococcus nepalensis]MBO1236632.1 tryptophan-rich sensory protein [Staphylococcus nepalensis]